MRARLRDPVLWTDAVQLLKTTAAAVIAWVLAVHVFGLSQPFLAPWAALLTVHATVYRTFSRGAQQVGATVLGVLLAFAAGSLFGVTAATLAVVVFMGLLAGRLRGLTDESTTAAATGLVVLLTGYSEESGALLMRLADTGIGIAVGVIVNLIVWAPLRHRSAARRIDALDDRLGVLLGDIAEQLGGACDAEDAEEWISRTREIDSDIDDAWAVVRQAWESGRYNPRRAARRRAPISGDFEAILLRLEQATAESRSMARTLSKLCEQEDRWDEGVRTRWVALLAEAAAAVGDADRAGLRDVRQRLRELSRALGQEQLTTEFWPVAGALVINLRNIVDAMGLVADAQPVSVPARHGRRELDGAVSRP